MHPAALRAISSHQQEMMCSVHQADTHHRLVRIPCPRVEKVHHSDPELDLRTNLCYSDALAPVLPRNRARRFIIVGVFQVVLQTILVQNHLALGIIATFRSLGVNSQPKMRKFTGRLGSLTGYVNDRGHSSS